MRLRRAPQRCAATVDRAGGLSPSSISCVCVLVRNSYYQLMLTLVPIWAVMALSWNMLSGYSG